jgi:hypothetical protein
MVMNTFISGISKQELDQVEMMVEILKRVNQLNLPD